MLPFKTSKLKVTFETTVNRLESLTLIMMLLDKLDPLGMLTIKLNFDNGHEKGAFTDASLTAYKSDERSAAERHAKRARDRQKITP